MPARRQVFLGLISLAVLTLLSCATVTRLAERAAATDPFANTPVPPPLDAVATGPRLGSLEETEAAINQDTPALEVDAAERYTNEELNAVGATINYTVQVAGPDDLRLWGYGWCATTPEILADNLSQMQFEFLLNGEPVALEQFLVLEGEDSNGLACAFFSVVVGDWPAGTTTFETVVTFLLPINDGLGDFEAGSTRYIHTVTAP